MLERPDLQQSYHIKGVLIVLFNALIFDLLFIGYGQNSDTVQVGELLSAVTLGAFFEAVLIVLFVFSAYTFLFKEPLIWVLSRIYFLVVFLRVLAYPFWAVGYEGGRAANPIQTARQSWRAYLRYQLGQDRGTADWTPTQHLAVATFFVFLLSLVSPCLGFHSLGYRLLPQTLTNLGVPSSYHWLGGAVLVVAICYICSNSMLALFGNHRDRFRLHYNRQNNVRLLKIIDDILSSYGKAEYVLQMIPPADHSVDKSRSALLGSLELAKSSMLELRNEIGSDLEADNSAITRALAQWPEH